MGGSGSSVAEDIVDIPGVFNIDSLLEVYPLAEDAPSRSEEIAWDSVSSMHLIQISGAVPSHYHAYHSKNLWVVRGAGRLVLDKIKYKVKAGDIVHVPKGTAYSFHNLGAVPAVIISVFSPGFDGKDRILNE
jgi:mannose-6-phosphate isomerase-like protein (cupin superfamily)